MNCFPLYDNLSQDLPNKELTQKQKQEQEQDRMCYYDVALGYHVFM